MKYKFKTCDYSIHTYCHVEGDFNPMMEVGNNVVHLTSFQIKALISYYSSFNYFQIIYHKRFFVVDFGFDEEYFQRLEFYPL